MYGFWINFYIFGYLFRGSSFIFRIDFTQMKWSMKFSSFVFFPKMNDTYALNPPPPLQFWRIWPQFREDIGDFDSRSAFEALKMLTFRVLQLFPRFKTRKVIIFCVLDAPCFKRRKVFTFPVMTFEPRKVLIFCVS